MTTTVQQNVFASTLDQHYFLAMFVAIAATSLVQSYTDLRQFSRTPLSKPITLLAAGLYRTVFMILFLFFVRLVLGLGQQLWPNVVFLLISNWLITGRVWSIAGVDLGLSPIYHSTILFADRIAPRLDPLYEAKFDLLAIQDRIRPRSRRRNTVDTVFQFRDIDIRMAFESDFEKRREVQGLSEANAESFLRRLTWPEILNLKTLPKEVQTDSGFMKFESQIEQAEIYMRTHSITLGQVQSYIDEKSKTSIKRESLSRTTEWSERLTRRYVLRQLAVLVGSERLLPTLATIPRSLELEASIQSEALLEKEIIRASAPVTSNIVVLDLKNIRCFEAVHFDFSNEGRLQDWTLLLGDNGLGKSTVLRCLAAALCDPAGATALMAVLPGDLLRQGANFGEISLRLRTQDEVEHWRRIQLARSADGTVSVSQEASPAFPREFIFVCGYGAMRSGFGTRDYAAYASSDAVRSLFDPSSPLQNPELALRRMQSGGGDLEMIGRRLESILMLEEGSTQITTSGISVRGPWGNFVPAGAIGDGYLATLAWVADFLGWAFLFSRAFLFEDVSGIVLIDEIEKHLHPRWQRQIISQLSKQFPNVQFIASTHSPICAGGLADLKETAGAMYRLSSTPAGAVETEKICPLVGWRYDQIVTSEAFGLASARDESTEEIVNRLRDARDAGDKDAIEELNNALAARSVTVAEDERDRAVREKFVTILQELAHKDRQRGD